MCAAFEVSWTCCKAHLRHFRSQLGWHKDVCQPTEAKPSFGAMLHKCCSASQVQPEQGLGSAEGGCQEGRLRQGRVGWWVNPVWDGSGNDLRDVGYILTALLSRPALQPGLIRASNSCGWGITQGKVTFPLTLNCVQLPANPGWIWCRLGMGWWQIANTATKIQEAAVQAFWVLACPWKNI